MQLIQGKRRGVKYVGVTCASAAGRVRRACSKSAKRSVMKVQALLDLSGKVALVTGGSRGLGLKIAEALGEMGARVALTARKPDELDQAAAQLDRLGIEVLTVAGDLTQFDTIPGTVQAVLSRFGAIDILVNNAGTNWAAPAEDYPREAWRRVNEPQYRWPSSCARRSAAAR